MLGVILCGGQSTRMGTDKGLIKLHANTWAQTAIDKVASLHLDVLLSVNSNQYNEYLAVFAPSQLIVDNESLSIRGPLAGLLSVHLQHPDEDLFVLACDMPLMENSVLQELLAAYREQPSADAYVFTNEGEPEPLCAIYSTKGLSYIVHLIQVNELTRHSMKNMLEHIHTFFIPLEDQRKRFFRNFNAHAELNGL